MGSCALFISSHMSLIKDITSLHCALLYKPLSDFWYSFKNIWMALTFVLHFFLEVIHHIHNEMLCLAFKVLSLESVINLRGRFVLSLWYLLALEVNMELNNAISITVKGKYVNYVIMLYYAYLWKSLYNNQLAVSLNLNGFLNSVSVPRCTRTYYSWILTLCA